MDSRLRLIGEMSPVTRLLPSTASTAGQIRRLLFLVASAALLATAARAQGVRRPAATSCPPRAAVHGAAFVFGNDGGNLRPSATRLWADGSVRGHGGSRTAPNAMIADSVRELARFARRSAFWTTAAPPITRPTRNPDMAREYIEAHLQCGAKRSLYPADAEPAPFRELHRRLATIAKLAGTR